MMNYYAHGGIANVAQNIATKGRNGDTQLLHVSPSELRGLQALANVHGTSLTMNPDTGLPEAFNFKKLIPMAAGAALAATGVGAPVAALMVGGGYGLATGSVKQGIMAGIGAYGGAGLATGLGAAGAATAEGAVAGEAARAAAGQELAKEAAVNAAAEGMTIPTNYADIAAKTATPAQVGAQMSTSSNLANMGRGVTELGSEAGRSAAYAAMPQGTLPATFTSLAMPSESSGGVPGIEDDEYTKRLKAYKMSPNYQASDPMRPNPYYRPTYAAQGGVMESFDDETGNDMARGGIASLGGYSDGGRMLKGPGDGMSDSIPGVIGGKQPARLADGEFVVPADVVSHLGNGSTDGGAKKLYAMMDKIRSARTGRKKQAPEVNAEKYLPIQKASGGMAGYSEGGIAGYAAGGVPRFNTGGVPSFSDAQVASYLQGNPSTTPAQANAIFGVSQAQYNNANALIAAGDPGIAAANAAYNAAIAANPSQAAANAQFVASQQAALAAGTPTYAQTLSSAAAPVTPVTRAPVAIDTRTTGPGGYTIPFFPPEAIASYLKEHKITTQPQIDQLKLIFNVNDAQITAAQNLIKDNPTLVDATTAKYRTDIAANPAQEAQNARDLQARMTQLNITTPLIPLVPPPVPLSPVTPQSTATTGPSAGSTVYRPGFVPRVSGVNMSEQIKDPYSNVGLESLYSQMMGQYGKATPPMSDAAVKALAERAYSGGSGAEVGRQLINAGIPVNQAISALKSYAGLTPEIVNQAYIGGQTLGTTPPPTLNTQYNYSDPGTYYRPPAPDNLILTRPIVDAAFKAPEPAPSPTTMYTSPGGVVYGSRAAYDAASTGGKAGGIVSIKHIRKK